MRDAKLLISPSSFPEIPKRETKGSCLMSITWLSMAWDTAASGNANTSHLNYVKIGPLAIELKNMNIHTCLDA